MPKFSGLSLSRAGAVLGSVLLVLGVALSFGFAYSLILLGALILTGSLLFIDTEPDERKELRR
ncbi:hypothetical protein SAMN05421811_1034 [Nonomuraea wenchangensis]|uniref:Uncharacterized protein n=1 Tax=Nonomuraea wenchangensis TaxID=568860 RepID=A0A1I0EDS1_9ACTN|nr:hypothetical protein SAMN05421811_1034 [Nonomuraea wenchangensis]